jgi:hypothetical protein
MKKKGPSGAFGVLSFQQDKLHHHHLEEAQQQQQFYFLLLLFRSSYF